MTYETFKVEVNNQIAQVSFNRPEKANAVNSKAWEEMKVIFEAMDEDPAVRVVILKGEGKHFCAGIDLANLMDIQKYNEIACEGRKRELMRRYIMNDLQAPITAIEKCRKPVIAAIHRACVGAGVDIVSACDMRYCTEDATFSIKEVDLGLVADVGTLQRLPHIIPSGIMAELTYTGRYVSGVEAAQIGLVNKVFDNHSGMMDYVMDIANTIAAKSPLVIRGSKRILKYTRDHSVEDSLDYVATWNAAMILSDDLKESFNAYIEKRKPVYND